MNTSEKEKTSIRKNISSRGKITGRAEIENKNPVFVLDEIRAEKTVEAEIEIEEIIISTKDPDALTKVKLLKKQQIKNITVSVNITAMTLNMNLAVTISSQL